MSPASLWARWGLTLLNDTTDIETSLVELSDEGRKVQKTKMVVLLKKSSSSPVIPEDDSEQTI